MHVPKPYDPTLNTAVFNGPFIRSWMGVAVVFFLIASVFGLTMRFLFVGELPFEVRYKYLLHAHSHVALMGWAFTVVSGALLFLFTPAASSLNLYKGVLAGSAVAGLGMAVAFPLQGYGAWSIGFSTLHLLMAYVFAYGFVRDLRSEVQDDAAKLARWGVYWMLISTAGLWAIGPVTAVLGKLHPLYFMCVQFFLHFQLNGWLTFGVLALLMRHLAGNGQPLQLPRHAFWALQLSLLLTYALSVTWSNPIPALFFFNSLGVVLQAVAFYLTLSPVVRALSLSWGHADWKKWVLLAGLGCIVLKVLVHVAVALPAVATISYTIKNFVIGFIHLVVIGSVSLSVAGVLLTRGLLPDGPVARYGWQMLLAAFIVTELLLMGQGLLLWMGLGFLANYHLVLFLASILFPLSLTLIASSFFAGQGAIADQPIPFFTNQLKSQVN